MQIHACIAQHLAATWNLVRMRIFGLATCSSVPRGWNSFCHRFCELAESVGIHQMESKSVAEIGDWLKENSFPEEVVQIFRGEIVSVLN